MSAQPAKISYMEDATAAWSPWGDGTDEGAAAAAARTWFRTLAVVPTVISPTKHRPDNPAILRMIDEGEWTSVRGKAPSAPGRRGVFVYRPNWKDLSFATSLWRNTGGAIFVMEYPPWPVAGWAAAVGAATLPDWAPARMSAAARSALEDLKTAGYKGYVDDISRRIALNILEKAPALRREGRPWVLSALIGLGMRGEQVERLPPMPGVVSSLNTGAELRTSRDWLGSAE